MSSVAPFLLLVTPPPIEKERAAITARLDALFDDALRIREQRAIEREARKRLKKTRAFKSLLNSRGWTKATRGSIPNMPGCYAIYRGRTLVYIGSTQNLNARLENHWRDSKRWGVTPNTPLTIKVRVSRKAGDWLMIEYRLIKRLRPEVNRFWIRPPRNRINKPEPIRAS